MFNNNNSAYELSIQMSSIQLSRNIVDKHDTVRVSITTIPEQQKQAIHVKGKEMNNFNHTFKVNITNETQRILVIFRKKDFLGYEQIIASTVIPSSQFQPIFNGNEKQRMPIVSEVSNVNVYEPLQKSQQRQQTRKNGENLYECICLNNNQGSRKVLGNIRIQYMLNECTSYINNYSKYNNKQKNYNYQYNENYNQRQFDNQYRNTTLEIY